MSIHDYNILCCTYIYICMVCIYIYTSIRTYTYSNSIYIYIHMYIHEYNVFNSYIRHVDGYMIWAKVCPDGCQIPRATASSKWETVVNRVME